MFESNTVQFLWRYSLPDYTFISAIRFPNQSLCMCVTILNYSGSGWKNRLRFTLFLYNDIYNCSFSYHYPSVCPCHTNPSVFIYVFGIIARIILRENTTLARENVTQLLPLDPKILIVSLPISLNPPPNATCHYTCLTFSLNRVPSDLYTSN